jgi:hypothetical protein
MVRWLGIVLGTLRSVVRTHRELALENLVLRQQFAVWKARQPRPWLTRFHRANCCLSARFSSANSRRVRTAERNVQRRIPSHLTMTDQIADHFAQRKIVATEEFLEGTRGGEVAPAGNWRQA